MARSILHVDLNNFFASVAVLSHPEAAHHPMAVCGDAAQRHGIVLSKNQLAKNCGVKTAETIWQAKTKCPELLIIPPDFKQYTYYSRLAKAIYTQYTDLVEPFGIDEAWLDVTGSQHLFGTGAAIADAIRTKLKTELGLTASVGVSFNKIFAKLGSDLKKPDATSIISEENFRQLIWPLPVGDLLYVGKATQRKLANRAIFTIGDLACRDPHALVLLLGKSGESLWQFANGLDTSPVAPSATHGPLKSISNSTTTPRDLHCNNDVKIVFYSLAESVAARLRKRALKGRTLSISIRTCDFDSIERQAKLPAATNCSETIAQHAIRLFAAHWRWQTSIRSLGIELSDLAPADGHDQLSLFQDVPSKINPLDAALDNIRARFGPDSIQRCIMLTDPQLSSFQAKEPPFSNKKADPR